MKDAIYHATQLAEYGLHGAGGDDTPEQQDWGADCIEAAIILWKQTANAIAKDPPEKLLICGKEYGEEELAEKVKEMRQKAKDLRKQS